jgi:Ca-activated chloride channel family protein
MLTVVAVWLAAASPVLADGIIIPEPRPPRPGPIPVDLAIKYHRVNVAIDNQVATTSVDQVFVNEEEFEVEGTYLFPLPEEAAISNFTMEADGRKVEGRLLNRDEARRFYEDIVRRRKDPALLEYVGRNAFQASIFPIPPQGERRITLSYSQVLAFDQGLVKYVYPLNTEKFSSKPLEEVVITVSLRSPKPIKAIYSPSHAIAVERKGDYEASISFEAKDVAPDKDFVLYYSLASSDFGVSLLSYKDKTEDGFFILLAAPQVAVGSKTIVAKDVVFVLDTSGSMDGEKIDQAKKSLEFILDHLNAEDRFNIVTFNTTITPYASTLRPAKERNDARRFVERILASGSTDIDRALAAALGMREKDGRPFIVIFLTDGLPTVGVTDPNTIIANVAKASTRDVRLFTFGLGTDVNTVLLDTIAQENRGTSAYVEPGDEIESTVSSFYAKVSMPLLSDIAIDFGSARVEDTYPQPLPDLFAGSQLVLVGRYRDGGPDASAPTGAPGPGMGAGSSPVTVTLKGTVNGEPRQFKFSDLMLRTSGGESFIPRLWATRKIGYLLTQIRLHGENRESVDEIVKLSLRYGVITPYTSFLIDERADVLSREGREKAAENLFRVFATPAPAIGGGAVQDSQSRQALRGADQVQGDGEAMRSVGDKTFLLRGGAWIDTAYDSKMSTVKVAFGSDEYFRLVARYPDLGPCFALGQRVIVVWEGQAYEVG